MNSKTEVDADNRKNAAPSGSQEADTEVGYGKPPVRRRFKKGHSGNPKGRPQNSKNLRTVLNTELDQLVSVRTGDGKVRKYPKRQAMVLATANKAIHGDAKAVQTLVQLDLQLNPLEVDAGGRMPTAKEDEEILEHFRAWKAKGL